MSQVVFPAVAARTRSYAEGVFNDFVKRHKIIKDDFPAGSLVMRQQVPKGSKLTPAWEGPYIVVHRSRGGPYTLRDSTNDLLCHKVPASQLRLVSYEGALSPDSFEVDHIVDHKGGVRDRSYLVRWKGFDPEDDSWVKHEDIQTLACIADYWEKKRNGSAPVGVPGHPGPKRRGAPANLSHSSNSKRTRRR